MALGHCYTHQRNAWMDTVTFQKWWKEVFLKEVSKQNYDKVVLLVDNCSSHETPEHPLVKIATLPPGVTSIYQPMGAGIIAALKARYRKELLSRMLNNAENFDTLRDLGSKITAGKRGLEYAHTPHMLDVELDEHFC